MKKELKQKVLNAETIEELDEAINDIEAKQEELEALKTLATRVKYTEIRKSKHQFKSKHLLQQLLEDIQNGNIEITDNYRTEKVRRTLYGSIERDDAVVNWKKEVKPFKYIELPEQYADGDGNLKSANLWRIPTDKIDEAEEAVQKLDNIELLKTDKINEDLAIIQVEHKPDLTEKQKQLLGSLAWRLDTVKGDRYYIPLTNLEINLTKDFVSEETRIYGSLLWMIKDFFDCEDAHSFRISRLNVEEEAAIKTEFNNPDLNKWIDGLEGDVFSGTAEVQNTWEITGIAILDGDEVVTELDVEPGGD